ncbi:hypothetical protein Bhyg_12148, partial [Pseudolycoriella hygida]
MQEHFIGSKSNTMENYPTTSDAVNDRSNQLESVEVADDFIRELEMDYGWEQLPEASEEIVDNWEQAPEALVEMTDDNSEQGADQRPGTPDELIEIADNASKELLPAKKQSAFLKVKAKGHATKKATILTKADIARFIDDAPDALWLDVKNHFVTTFNNSGSSRELRNASVQNRNLRSMEFNRQLKFSCSNGQVLRILQMPKCDN